MKIDLLLFRLSLLCIIMGPISFIIGMNMDSFYGDAAWAAALAWWGFGIISFVVGIILLIITSRFKSSNNGKMQ